MVMIMEKRKTKKISSLQLFTAAGIEIVWTQSDPSEKIFQAICTNFELFLSSKTPQMVIKIQLFL